MTEESKKPGFINRLFGYNPEETLRKTAEAERATKEIKALGSELQKRMDANLERQKAAGKAELAASRAEFDRAREKRAHLPNPLGNVIDLKLVTELTLSKGLSTQEAYAQAGINQFDDGYGNIIYCNPGVGLDQVQTISAKITEQQKSFSTLGSDEQTKARNEFGSAKGITTSPYQDFLQSEALGKRFQELKQPHTSPK